MLGTSAGAGIFLGVVLLGTLLGVGAGGIAGLALRQHWSLEVAVKDAVLAAVAVVAAAYLLTAIEVARGDLSGIVVPVLCVGAASAVARRLYLLRS
jgi:hypothetical protein